MESKAPARSPGESLSSAVQRHYEELQRFLTRKIGCPSLAADIIQDLWIKLRLGQPAGDIRYPRAYLFRVASNLAIDRIRQEKSRARIVGPMEEGDDAPSDQPSAETQMDYHQRLAILQRAIDELPPRCRDVFLLHKFAGLSHLEIASRLGLARTTVEQHVMRGLAHCRMRMKEGLE